MEEIIGTEIIHPQEIRLGHTWHEAKVIRDYIWNITANDPWSFFEVGVHEGGLAYWLLPQFLSWQMPDGTLHYVGIEINCGIVRTEVLSLFNPEHDAELICQDCLVDIHRILSHNKPGNRIIYCDNGHKAEELVAYAPHCQSGDILMAHDFWDGIRQVRGVPEPHPEVLPADIEFLENDPTFERLPEELFKETRIIGFRKL